MKQYYEKSLQMIKENKITNLKQYTKLAKKYNLLSATSLEYISRKDFDNLSPGWKTAVILDIMLKYDKDNAPLIIDQPEDNLANTYINQDLITGIKLAKKRKQIIRFLGKSL